MTATEQFIEDAMRGGWGSHIGKKWRVCAGYVEHMQTYWGKGVWERVIAVSTVLLSPSAWQAVGETRGWRIVGPTRKDNDHNPQSYYEMQDFVGRLHDGLTIEEALSKLV